MDRAAVRLEVNKLARAEGEARPSEDEFNFAVDAPEGGLFGPGYDDFESDDGEVIWERIRMLRRYRESLGMLPMSPEEARKKGPVDRSSSSGEVSPLCPSPGNEAKWSAHSRQLWENYTHLQTAALTLLGHSKPIPLQNLESELRRIAATEDREGEQLYLSYYRPIPDDPDGRYRPWFMPVYRGRNMNQTLARIAYIADWIGNDLHCSPAQATVFLLSNVKTLLPWIEISIDRRNWSVDGEQMGVPKAPDSPPYPPGDGDLVLTLRVGSVNVPVKDVARAYREAKREAIARFAGKSWEEVTIEKISNPLLHDWDGNTATSRAQRRPRSASASTAEMAEFVRGQLDAGRSWKDIYAEWRQRSGEPTYTSMRSMRESFYRVNRRSKAGVR